MVQRPTARGSNPTLRSGVVAQGRKEGVQRPFGPMGAVAQCKGWVQWPKEGGVQWPKTEGGVQWPNAEGWVQGPNAE